MATAQECDKALNDLAARLAAKDATQRSSGFDRSLSCTITDLNLIYAGRLHDGLLLDIATATSSRAQVRLEMTGDDLIAMVAGSVNLASAWAGGRIKVHAGVLDMIKLRSIF